MPVVRIGGGCGMEAARMPRRAGSTRLLAPLLAIVLVLATAALAGAEAAWLNGTPQPWNRAGAAAPAAPKVDPAPQARCADRERAAAGPEEAQLAAAGWKLEEYWPAVRSGDVTLVTALASYDGMCRPWQLNAFVFVGGRFAGTIAPQPMDSRTDGVLVDGPTVRPNESIEASFTRYAPTDPLCCPSRGRALLTYRLDRGTAGPVLLVDQIAAIPPASAAPAATGSAQGAAAGPASAAPAATPARPAAPSQLPRTGELSALSLAAIGAGIVAIGLLVRLRTRAGR